VLDTVQAEHDPEIQAPELEQILLLFPENENRNNISMLH